MTDLNSSTLKNNFIQGECGKFSDPLNSFEILHSNAAARSNSSNMWSNAGTSCLNTKINEDPVSPGTEVSASAMSEDEIIFHNFPASAIEYEQSKYNVVDECEKTIVKKTKIPVSSDSSVKYNVDTQDVSSNSKSRNSSNFSIFGQLLNKKQNNSLATKSSVSTGNNSFSTTFKSNAPSRATRNEVTEHSDGMQRAQMKTKLRSMWNNVKYGWRIKREVNLKTDSAIWLLGQFYHNKLSDDLSLTQDVAEQLRLDLLSKIWLTYRINFPAIPGTNIISDSGWGCMLRCGQMMMAQAFVCHFLKRDWRVSCHRSEAESQLYKTILKWFGDSLSDKSPFSLHHLVLLGQNYGRKAGDWYGPTHAAHVLRDALCKANSHNLHLQQLCMYVASDGIVFKQDIMELCLSSVSEEKTNSLTSLSSDFVVAEMHDNLSEMMSDSADCISENLKVRVTTSEGPNSFEATCPSYSQFGPPSYSNVQPKWRSLILFVSVRLGNDKINPFYIPCLKSLLAYENCIGIIGGRPKHALYFIGWQDDKIIHMDPHSCQPAVDVEKEDFNEKSFHSSSVRMMAFTDMDPSCSIGFYFRELKDFQVFVEKFSEITAPLKRNLEYPVFALVDGKRDEAENDIDHPNEKCIYPPLSDSYLDDDDNDYILL